MLSMVAALRVETERETKRIRDILCEKAKPEEQIASILKCVDDPFKFASRWLSDINDCGLKMPSILSLKSRKKVACELLKSDEVFSKLKGFKKKLVTYQDSIDRNNSL